jgi:hypothetical protein
MDFFRREPEQDRVLPEAAREQVRPRVRKPTCKQQSQLEKNGEFH